MSVDSREADIKKIVDELNLRGRGVPTRISQITDFPYQEYSVLLAAFKSGEARLLRFAYALETSLFSMLASKSDKIKSNIGMFIVYGGVLGAIIFSFIYSWWLLILLPALFAMGTSITNRAYNNAIFDSAFNSELVFCFLYFSGQVSVNVPKLNRHFYHKSE